MNSAILQIIKRFLPQIQQAALPAITSVLKHAVGDVQLEDGEDSACITISCYNDVWWAFVVTMSPENKVIRTVKEMKLEDLLSEGFEIVNKEC